MGRFVERSLGQLVTAPADAALHVGFAGLVVPQCAAKQRCAPPSRDFRNRLGWLIVARNANAVSGPTPGTDSH